METQTCEMSTPLLLLIATCLFLTHAQEIYISGPYQLCQLSIENYAVILNATAYKDAQTACDAFGMDLLEVGRMLPIDVDKLTAAAGQDAAGKPVMSSVGTLLLDCAVFGGVQVTAGWVSTVNGKGEPVGGTDANCFAIDFTGTLVNGSLSSCRDGQLYPVCKRRQGQAKVVGQLLRSGKERLPRLPDAVMQAPVDLPADRPDLAAATVHRHKNPCPTTVAKPTCPLSLLGYKVIAEPMPYVEAECACRALGMTMADASFISFWPAAFLTHHCAGSTMSASMAWIRSEPDCKLCHKPAPKNGCMVMRAQKLELMGPHVEPQPCNRMLPVVCQGPVLAGWSELEPLFAMAGIEGVTDALNSVYPLPRLPTLSDIARLATQKSFGGQCRSSRYQVVSVRPGESPESACTRVGKTSPAAIAGDRSTMERLVRECQMIDSDGVRLGSPAPGYCAFMDRMGSYYLATTSAAMTLYAPCRRPTTVLCE